MITEERKKKKGEREGKRKEETGLVDEIGRVA